MSTLLFSSLLLCSSQVVIEQEPSITTTPVVFHYDGALFPGRRPLFGLQAKDGTILWSEPGIAKHRIRKIPSGQEIWYEFESQPNGGVIWGVPEGQHTFVVKSTPFQEILRIPNVEVKAIRGYGCYPDVLQNIQLVERDSIAVSFEDAEGQFLPLRHWDEEDILVMHEMDDRLIQMPNRILDTGKVRISTDYLADDYWLLMKGYLPVPLHGWQDGDVVPLRRMQGVSIKFLRPEGWPRDAGVTIDITPDSESRAMDKVQAAQGCLRYEPEAEYIELFFPKPGRYAMNWSLRLWPYSPFDTVETMGGGIIQLPPADPTILLELRIPSTLAAIAKRELEVSKNAPTPVIEMQAAAPPPELPERPPR